MSDTSSPLTDSSSGTLPGTRRPAVYSRSGTGVTASSANGPDPSARRTPQPASDTGPVAEPVRVPDSTDYHNERRRYLARARKSTSLRQKYLRSLLGYLLVRAAWSFGFFPVVLAFWVPLVMAEFNPVVMVQGLLPHLQAFVSSNPEIQARTVNTLLSGWLSVSLFFYLFDVVINPFRSPFQQEADIHMRAWSQSQGLVPPDEM